MKPEHYLTSAERYRYINMSENLRRCLEVKLDELYKNREFGGYLNIRYAKHTLTDEVLVSVVIGKPFNDEVFARRICRAVKTWYGMYYDDRRSVLEKFLYYCKLCIQYKGVPGEANFPFIFTRFLVNEFATELSDVKWSLLARYHQQGVSAKDH